MAKHKSSSKLFTVLRLLLRAIVLFWRLAVLIVEFFFWVGRGLMGLGHLFVDVVAARRSLAEGGLHCPVGHPIPTEGGMYECTACGFRYGGENASVWRCENPECTARATPYVNCPTCGLSVRSPHRWGRP